MFKFSFLEKFAWKRFLRGNYVPSNMTYCLLRDPKLSMSLSLKFVCGYLVYGHGVVK